MSWLSDRNPQSRIPLGELAYVSSVFRSDVHSRVLQAFEESRLSQRELAARLNKNPGQVSRMLGAAGNWTLDTVAQLIYAIEGNLVEISIVDPNEGAAANYTVPDWLNQTGAGVEDKMKSASPKSFPPINVPESKNAGIRNFKEASAGQARPKIVMETS